MLEKIASLLVVLVVAVLAIPFLEPSQETTRGKGIGLFDLWDAEPKLKQLTSAVNTHKAYWKARDAIAQELVHGQIDLRTAANRLRVEAEVHALAIRAHEEWREKNTDRSWGRVLVDVLLTQLETGKL